MRLFSTALKIFSVFIITSMIAFGQASLKGTVTDAATNETLIGVNVIIQGTSLGAATDIEGQFWVVGIPQRVFNVKISYVGYEPQIKEVDFSKVKDVVLDVQLKPAVIEGEEVVVTAQMRGQLAAINQQITSNTIVNVVSEEKIKELPDANAAEAIGRLPGVAIIRSGGEATNIVLRGLSSKFSNITVDGVKIPATDLNTRDVDLSTMSQGSLAGIELFKTLTPDKDADAIAGSVNLVTKKAPSEREIRVDVKGGYNHLMKSTKQYDLSGRYAERFFDDILGLQLQVNSESKIRSKEDVIFGYFTYRNSTAPNYNPTYNNDYNINLLRVDFTDEIRKRNGAQTIIDINTPDSGSVKFSAMYSSTKRNYLLHNRVYDAGVGVGWNYDYRNTEQEISTVNSSLQGKNYVLGLIIDWGVSYAHSEIDNPFDLAYRFTEPSTTTSGGSIPPQKDHPEDYANYAFNNWLAAVCSTSNYLKIENFDKERTANVDISKKYTIGYLFAGEVKGGAKYRERERWAKNDEFDANYYLNPFFYDNIDGSKKNLLGTRFEEYFKSSRTAYGPSLSDFIDYPVSSRHLLELYKMNPLISQDAMKLWYNLNKNGKFGSLTEYVNSLESALDDYTVTERITSVYLMNTLNIGQTTTILLGARVEKEVNDYNANFAPGGLSRTGIVADKGEIEDSSTTYTETIWLPNAQLTIKPTDFLTVRLAAYKALARPDYSLRLAKFGLSSQPPNVPNSAPVLRIGNPSLKNTTAWNYEVNTQVYGGTIGLVSISAFYKVIDNLYHEMNSVRFSWVADPYRSSGDPANLNSDYYMLDSLLAVIGAGWQNDPRFVNTIHTGSTRDVFIAYNSPDRSYAWGFEFEHQMNFGFLPVSWLQSITLSYNISITRSETNIILSKTVADSVWDDPPGPRPGSWQPAEERVPTLEKRQSEDQPELYLNASLGYDIAGFSARISVFYQDEYTRFYSFDGDQDVVVDSFTKLDLALKQKISPNVDLFLNINNLTNQQDATSQVNNIMGWDLPLTAELYGTTVDFGVRVSM